VPTCGNPLPVAPREAGLPAVGKPPAQGQRGVAPMFRDPLLLHLDPIRFPDRMGLHLEANFLGHGLSTTPSRRLDQNLNTTPRPWS